MKLVCSCAQIKSKFVGVEVYLRKIQWLRRGKGSTYRYFREKGGSLRKRRNGSGIEVSGVCRRCVYRKDELGELFCHGHFLG